MASLDEAIRQTWAPNLNAVARKPRYRLQDWLKRGAYQVHEDISAEEFRLDFVNEVELLEAFAFDINRFAASAFESVASIAEVRGFPRSIAWNLVKLYYAAFYAAHALLRVQGIACCQVDISEVLNVRRIARA